MLSLGWSTLDHIQTECNQALALWNYRKINRKLNKKKLLDEAANTKKKPFLKNSQGRNLWYFYISRINLVDIKCWKFTRDTDLISIYFCWSPQFVSNESAVAVWFWHQKEKMNSIDRPSLGGKVQIVTRKRSFVANVQLHNSSLVINDQNVY